MKKYLVLGVLLLALVFVPTTAKGEASIAELQAMIAQLMAQLQALREQQGNQDCYTFTRDLYASVGGGQDVTQLQTLLGKEGFPINEEGPSGPYFGELTAAAVVKFQAKYGILQTGYVGPITRAKLNSLGCGNDNGCSTFVRNLALGSTGEDVILVQKHLMAKGFLVTDDGNATNYFGPLSQASLRRYQASVGINEDGFGPLTRAHFNSVIGCSEIPEAACGTAQGVVTATKPTENLCRVGDVSNQRSNSVNWLWNCSTTKVNDLIGCWAPKSTTTQPSITVTSPNGGESIPVGGTITVKWSSKDVPATALMTAILVNDSGSDFALFANELNDGSATIKLNANTIPAGRYKVSINAEERAWGYDSGDAYFTIASANDPAIIYSKTSAVIPSTDRTDGIRVTWNIPAGAKNYAVYRCSGPTLGTCVGIPKPVSRSGNDTEYLDTAAPVDTDTWYAIDAQFADGQWGGRAISTAAGKRLAVVVPPPPVVITPATPATLLTHEYLSFDSCGSDQVNSSFVDTASGRTVNNCARSAKTTAGLSAITASFLQFDSCSSGYTASSWVDNVAGRRLNHCVKRAPVANGMEVITRSALGKGSCPNGYAMTSYFEHPTEGRIYHCTEREIVKLSTSRNSGSWLAAVGEAFRGFWRR